MRIGNLKDTVTIQVQSQTKDAMGGYPDTWTDVVTRRASIEPLNGREYFASSGENAEVTTRIRMRYDSTVGVTKPHHQIVDQSVSPQIEYGVLSVINPRERNREIVFMCKRSG